MIKDFRNCYMAFSTIFPSQILALFVENNLQKYGRVAEKNIYKKLEWKYGNSQIS